MQVSLLIKELGHRDDVGSIILNFNARQIQIDLTGACAEFDLTLQAAVAPVEQNNGVDALHLCKFQSN